MFEPFWSLRALGLVLCGNLWLKKGYTQKNLLVKGKIDQDLWRSPLGWHLFDPLRVSSPFASRSEQEKYWQEDFDHRSPVQPQTLQRRLSADFWEEVGKKKHCMVTFASGFLVFFFFFCGACDCFVFFLNVFLIPPTFFCSKKLGTLRVLRGQEVSPPRSEHLPSWAPPSERGGGALSVRPDLVRCCFCFFLRCLDILKKGLLWKSCKIICLNMSKVLEMVFEHCFIFFWASAVPG